MKIFNIGFSKCGTVSLTIAFDILGFKSVHWLHKGVRLEDIIEDNKKHKRPLLYGLEEYDFLSDLGGMSTPFYKELGQEYPDSKFILAIRDLETWLVSMEKHVKRNQQNPDYKYDFLKIEKDKWTKWRKQQFTEIKEYFKNRPKDFLIINIVKGDGWEKLCSFLEKPVPNEVFPHKHKTIN